MEEFLEEFQHLRIQLGSIKSATGNFDPNYLIGKGGFRMVYKGVLSHSKGKTMVAFKRLDRRYGQRDPQFWKEILMLSRYTHENLISLLGVCNEDGENILVYEHAFHRSLDLHLSSTTLKWKQRLKICFAVAKGLSYLHDPKDTQQRVLHRDIKSSNILLDENWNAKVSDMGLSKIGPANQQHTYLVSNIVGTFGYIDPLYMEMNILTKESDVYYFGVVMFQVLFRRLCFENNNGRLQSLVRRWKKRYKEKKLDEIIFHELKHDMDPRSLETFSDIAYQCLQKYHKERPKMSLVVEKLEIALSFQENFEENTKTELVARLDLRNFPHGCEHYHRKCKLRAPCCNKVFWCHHCHNNDPNERHKMVLKDVTQVFCMVCNMEQNVDRICGNCEVKMVEYFCGICNLFDDDPSRYKFHCYKCGICRRDAREENYRFHKYGCCFVVEMRGSHTCVENCMKNNCPVCHEYLFDSIKRMRLLYCGHGIHVDCYNQMLEKKTKLIVLSAQSSSIFNKKFNQD